MGHQCDTILVKKRPESKFQMEVLSLNWVKERNTALHAFGVDVFSGTGSFPSRTKGAGLDGLRLHPGLRSYDCRQQLLYGVLSGGLANNRFSLSFANIVCL